MMQGQQNVKLSILSAYWNWNVCNSGLSTFGNVFKS